MYQSYNLTDVIECDVIEMDAFSCIIKKVLDSLHGYNTPLPLVGVGVGVANHLLLPKKSISNKGEQVFLIEWENS